MPGAIGNQRTSQKGVCEIVDLTGLQLIPFLHDPITEAPEIKSEVRVQFHFWQQKRERFLSMLGNKEEEAVKQGWEKDYFKGVNGQGEKFCEHQMQIELKEFKRG